nr:hypothetical protein BgiMline_029288 [Biomphalaria glabrata]
MLTISLLFPDLCSHLTVMSTMSRPDSKCNPPATEQKTRKETTQTGPAPQQNADDEFQIAADLTLYANPLRCLHHKKVDCGLKDGNSQQGQGKSLTEEAAEEAGDIIAADLTMYGSPLDDN